MFHKIRIEPSGRHFTVEGDETLLEAALRNGVPLRYGCANGSCGECRAQVREGQVETVRFHDFPLAQAERVAGWVLMCASAPRSDCLIEASVAGDASDIPQQRVRARPITTQVHEGAIVTVRLKVSRGAILRFLAGQQARLEFPGDLAATTWIASCPCDGQQLEFHFDVAEDPAVCAWLRDSARRTDHVAVSGPLGAFTLDERAARPLLFIASDASFAPMQSLIEHAINLELDLPMRLYWRATRPSGHYADNLARAWADALDEFRYVPLRGDGGDEETFVAAILRDCPALDAYDAYVAGSPRLLEAARRILTGAGLPAERCFQDVREAAHAA